MLESDKQANHNGEVGRNLHEATTGSGNITTRLNLDPTFLIDYDELVFQDRISESATAKVYQGEYRGQEVAIKIFNSEMIDVEKLQQEFTMISAIRSPHVVVFYGLCIEPKLCVVMEYCARGTLEEVLETSNGDDILDWSRFFQLAKGLASAINVLHRWKPQIIHREIRPQNLLMTDDWQIKFCDFGRARYNEKGDEALKSQTLDSGIDNAAYTAPEVYKEGTYSTKTDVYSVGIVLWEIAMRVVTGSHQKPFQDLLSQGLNSFQILRKTCMQGLRPPTPDTLPASLCNVLKSCWEQEADQRPIASGLTKELATLFNTWKKERASWKVAINGDDDDEDDDGDGDLVTPRNSKDDGKPVLDDSAQKLKDEQIRQVIENQVQERLREEEKKLQQALKDKYPSGGGSPAGVAEIDPKEVILIGEPIGSGQFGEVWRGTLHGKDVAVKKLFIRDDVEENVLRDFRKEVEVMITLRHPNICLLMGACTQPGNLMIIMEFLSNGSVYDLIHGKRKRILSFEQRLKMAKDCALGMNWLHHMNPPFLHLDLKPHNLLVDANLNVKVADFGLSQMKGREEDDLGGSPFYMAPEVLLGRGASEKSDVYSFGIVLWQIASREEPYKGQFADEDELIMSVCDDNMRPPIPDDLPPSCVKLIQDCWAPEDTDRPSFQQILEQRIFEKIMVEYEIVDPKAASFWAEYFCTEKKPTWLEFWACLVKYLKSKEVLSERDPKLEYFKTALVDGDDPRDPDAKVTRDNFNKFVLYFGPCELNGMVDRLLNVVKSSYFHGDLSKKKASSMLAKQKKNGLFLVRYSTKPGDFIISVFSKQKHGSVDHHIVTVLRETGQYVLLIPPAGTTLNMTIDTHRTAVLSKSPAAYPTLDALINAQKKVLGITKPSKFLPYKGGGKFAIRMPAEENSRSTARYEGSGVRNKDQGGDIAEKHKESKDRKESKDKKDSKKSKKKKDDGVKKGK